MSAVWRRVLAPGIALVAGLFMLLFVPVAAHSEPGPVVRYLFDTPASLFDLGMYRLNKDLNDKFTIETYGYIFITWATYDWNKNRIVIALMAANADDILGNTATKMIKSKIKGVIPNQSAPLIDIWKTNCKSIIEDIRALEGMVFEGKLLRDDKNSAIANLFGHYGYSDNKEPLNYKKKLDDIIEIQVTKLSGENGNDVEILCRGDLISSDVFYGE